MPKDYEAINLKLVEFTNEASLVITGLYETLDILILNGEHVNPSILGIMQDCIEHLKTRYPEFV